jgi:hypothetical protein
VVVVGSCSAIDSVGELEVFRTFAGINFATSLACAPSLGRNAVHALQRKTHRPTDSEHQLHAHYIVAAYDAAQSGHGQLIVRLPTLLHVLDDLRM